MEKIGQVILDDTLYPGKDLYTDGAIEDEMLEIARNYREDHIPALSAKKPKRLPVLNFQESAARLMRGDTETVTI